MKSYRLKHTSRIWHEKLKDNSDVSLFIKQDSLSFTILLVYVDDVILPGDSLLEMLKIKEALHKEFKIKDLGKLKYFFGI